MTLAPRRRRAPVDRRAADRHGAGRARGVRAGLRRRARGRSWRWAFDYMQKDGEGEPSERNWLRDETGGSVYLRLSTRPVEQIKRDDDAGPAPADRRRRLLAAPAGAELPGGGRLYRRGRAGGDRGGRADGGRPARRRAAGGHLGRPSQRRLDRGAARARARPRACALAHRAPVGRRAAALRDVTVLDGHPATLAWLGAVPAIAHARSAWSISARPAGSPTSTATTASTPTPSSPPRRRSRPAARSGTSRRCLSRRTLSFRGEHEPGHPTRTR